MTLELDNGRPFKLEPWQAAFVRDVFAGYREAWLVVPEGNGKTTLFGALGLYHVRFRDDAFVPVAASSRDQARILYRQAKGFVRRTPELALRFRCFDGYRRIDHRAGGSQLEIFAADERTGDGVIPTLCILDELHRHRSLDLYETWRGKLEKRDGQLIAISTAGEPGSEFEETRSRIRSTGVVTSELETFRRVESGRRLVLHEWFVPATGDVDDMALVARANPLRAITPARLTEKRASPTMSPGHWRRFTCNIPTLTDHELLILPADWNAIADAVEIPAGASITIGADGSRVWDTTVVAWAHKTDDGRIDVRARVFGAVPDRPHHVLHSGGKIDFDDVEAFLLDLFAKYHPIETAYDPRYLERSMELVDARLPSLAIHPVEPHSKQARDALQSFYTAVAERVLRHDGDAVVAEHLSNCKVERDPATGAIRRIGKIDQRKNIDAVPAMALAVWRALEAQVSPYKERGVIFV